METKITEFKRVDANIKKLICTWTWKNPYNYAQIIDTDVVPINVLDLVNSLEPSPFVNIKSTIQREVLEKKWKIDQGHNLKAKTLSFKLWKVLNSISMQVKINSAKTTLLYAPVDVFGFTVTSSLAAS